MYVPRESTPFRLETLQKTPLFESDKLQKTPISTEMTTLSFTFRSLKQCRSMQREEAEHLDQLAKPTFRSRYVHTPFGTE